MEALGIDVGGTGIKGALVNTTSGELLTERYRLLTPHPATPKAVVGVVREIAKHFDWRGSLGCGFPAPIKNGVAYAAANISKRWVGVNARKLMQKATTVPIKAPINGEYP